MREVEASAESAEREPEPTEVGDADRWGKPDKMLQPKDATKTEGFRTVRKGVRKG